MQKKPGIKGHIWYHSIYMKCPQQVHPRGQKADLQMLGEASDGEWLLNWKSYTMGGIKSYFGNRGGGCTIMNLADYKYTKSNWIVHFEMITFVMWISSLFWKTCIQPQASLVAQMVKKSACNAGDLGPIPGLGRSHGEGKGYPLQYSGLWKSRTTERLSLFTLMHRRRKWQPTPVFLPGESQGWGSLVGCNLWGRTESDMTEAT